MVSDKLQRRKSFPAMLFGASVLFGILFIATGFIAPAIAEDSITISCYRDATSLLSLGNIVVYDVAEAARACNSTYYDCRGRCIGCYHDFDYVDNVCVDVQGNTFLK